MEPLIVLHLGARSALVIFVDEIHYTNRCSIRGRNPKLPFAQRPKPSCIPKHCSTVAKRCAKQRQVSLHPTIHFRQRLVFHARMLPFPPEAPSHTDVYLTCRARTCGHPNHHPPLRLLGVSPQTSVTHPCRSPLERDTHSKNSSLPTRALPIQPAQQAA